jgi:hypothetical protein
LTAARTAHELGMSIAREIEIIFEIGDALCRKLGDHPFARRRNRGSLLG